MKQNFWIMYGREYNIFWIKLEEDLILPTLPQPLQ